MKNNNLHWRPVRRDELWDDENHDPYRSREKYSDGTRCPDCGAHYHHGRWHWVDAAVRHEKRCPACARIHDQYPAGYVHITGEFAHAHWDDIVRLMRHREALQKAEHPLERIMSLRVEDGDLAVTTTGVHLAKNLGDALHSAYKGALTCQYNDSEHLLRVAWSR